MNKKKLKFGVFAEALKKKGQTVLNKLHEDNNSDWFNKAYQSILQNEGFSETPYSDRGLSIGYGVHIANEKGEPVDYHSYVGSLPYNKGKPMKQWRIKKEDAQRIATQIAREKLQQLKKLTGLSDKDLTPSQWVRLVDWSYTTNPAGFTNAMRYLKKKDLRNAAKEIMNSKAYRMYLSNPKKYTGALKRWRATVDELVGRKGAWKEIENELRKEGAL